MQKITFKKFKGLKASFLFFWFLTPFYINAESISAPEPIIVTGVTICKGDSGTLKITDNSQQEVTTFVGHWNSETDPTANTLLASLKNSTVCGFFHLPALRNYTATTFTVSVSGTYTFKMSDTEAYDGAAYIYTGNFTPGKCDGGGTWIIGDDDYDGYQKEPLMSAHFDSGVTYTLISTLWAPNGGTYVGDYTWSVTSPPGSNFILNTLNYWYASSTGGAPIGWGPTFNPVGVKGSGLLNTNTAGTTTYYVTSGQNSTERIPVDFVIIDRAAVERIANEPMLFINTPVNLNIHETKGIKKIASATGLPPGVTASYASDLVTISGTPTALGNYDYNIALTGNCGNVTASGRIRVIVTSKPAKVSTPITICSGAEFLWTVNNKTYNVAGTYTEIGSGSNPDQELVLTVTPKPAKVSTPITICSGATYTWSENNQVYNTSGTYTKTNTGCIADQELVLTVTPKPAKVSTPITICSGATYTWSENNQVYSTSGTYTKTNTGCTADHELVLTVTPKPAKISTPITICSGATYIWSENNQVYNTSGTYTKTNTGCTADQELVLTVTPKPAKISTPITICAGATYTWSENNQVYNTSGTYTKTNTGCTADQELVLTVTPKPAKISTPITICAGATYTWSENNQVYDTAGTYIITNAGCTADQELVLTVTPKPDKVSTPITICSGATYIWSENNQVYDTAGTYIITNAGCTADQELVLTVTPKPAKISTPITICSGATYTWSENNQVYNTSGTYTKTNTGCIADQELVLTVTPKPAKVSTPITICAGATYTWSENNETYDTAGIYTKTNTGCTADQELVLTVTPKPTKISTPITICAGATYTWSENNEIYDTAGTYTITNAGCTADQELVLTVTPKQPKISTPITICAGATYSWSENNQVYNTSGTYTKTNTGCIADQELVLTVTPKPAKVSTPITICSRATYTWSENNQIYDTAGTYTITNAGCTADQELVLTVTPKPAKVSTPITICSGATYTWSENNEIYDTAGTYTITNDECTADQVLNLIISSELNASLVPNSIFSESCIENKDASFKIEIIGGTQPYRVNLDNTSGIYEEITGSEHQFSNLSGGLYSVHILDALGCSTNLEIDVPNAVAINPVAKVNTECIDNLPSNSVTVTVDSGIMNLADIQYTLDGNSNDYQTTNVFTNLNPGEHTITARHVNGCEQTTLPFTIDEFEPLALSINDGEINEIVAIAAGGVKNYQYTLNGEYFGAVDKFIINKSGIYEITVTDKNGCTATASRYFEFIDLCMPNYFTPNGDGINDEWGPDCATNYKI